MFLVVFEWLNVQFLTHEMNMQPSTTNDLEPQHRNDVDDMLKPTTFSNPPPCQEDEVDMLRKPTNHSTSGCDDIKKNYFGDARSPAKIRDRPNLRFLAPSFCEEVMTIVYLNGWSGEEMNGLVKDLKVLNAILFLNDMKKEVKWLSTVQKVRKHIHHIMLQAILDVSLYKHGVAIPCFKYKFSWKRSLDWIPLNMLLAMKAGH